MEWFGITSYGNSNPFDGALKDTYKEPTEPKDLAEVYEESGKKGSFAMSINEIDVYIGQADGYAYKSLDRLLKMRRKSCLKPVGPNEMYKIPLTSAMSYGWFLGDSALEGKTWFRSKNKYE